MKNLCFLLLILLFSCTESNNVDHGQTFTDKLYTYIPGEEKDKDVFRVNDKIILKVECIEKVTDAVVIFRIEDLNERKVVFQYEALNSKDPKDEHIIKSSHPFTAYKQGEYLITANVNFTDKTKILEKAIVISDTGN